MNDVIAVLGGTFDPIHYGHLGLAGDVRDGLGLPEVRFVPAGDPRHRPRAFAPAKDRLAMTRLGCSDFSGFVVDDREVRREGASYTVDTLRSLRAENPRRPLALILGSDAFAGLDRWHLWKDLFSLCHFIVAERPGAPLESWTLSPPLSKAWEERYTEEPAALFRRTAGTIVRQAIKPRPISATALREALSQGCSGYSQVRGLLPPAVLAYIERNHLYRPRADVH